MQTWEPPEYTSPVLGMAAGVVLLIVIGLVGLFYLCRWACSSGKKRPAQAPERIIERILVICPYCGSKNEQGLLKCRNCGAEI
ncbi:MAG: hypothetical protein ACXAEN_21305 [Candidatus Thorarchaeota archaeon]